MSRAKRALSWLGGKILNSLAWIGGRAFAMILSKWWYALWIGYAIGELFYYASRHDAFGVGLELVILAIWAVAASIRFGWLPRWIDRVRHNGITRDDIEVIDDVTFRARLPGDTPWSVGQHFHGKDGRHEYVLIEYDRAARLATFQQVR